ncbi:MAG: bifunctional UDP-N-acetylglucosamine diphosphorylase/glucosamine-1-phosphate N-acetyltransferase GlmU [Acidobacteria bacterium]|nr:bifunctional UDP-N-acetylglucosamine diphosphorylase/glucosamine-1-phosphate N-acetyltransferase GlmU [Acidobacteriota bacterium]
MTDLYIVVLAAGKGTRMKSSLPKVLHPLAGRPIIEHVLRTAAALSPVETIVVIGQGADEMREALAGRHERLTFVMQSPQLGTGHAVLQAEPVLQGRRGTLLVLYGDVPLLQASTLQRLLEHHRSRGAAATVLTANLPDPFGYGRIVRDAQGRLTRIVEERDASGDQRSIREINSGIYAFDLNPLFPALHSIGADNAQGEYYLTDLVAMYHQRRLPLETLTIDDAGELRGVNTRLELADLGVVVRDRKRRSLMLAGVTLEDPSSAHIDDDVEVGSDTVIGPNVLLTGRTTIGAGCRIHAGVRISDSAVADGGVVLDHSVIVHSTIGRGATVGPFAHLRPGSRIGEAAHIGSFVETKNATFGARSKAGHLTYLGDATIGQDVNIGAGTITCNYDGERKHDTVIEDGVFIGSDSQLVAPVTIGRGAYVAAGSSITESVPAGALAVGRARQVVKVGWASPQARRTPGQPEQS